MAAARGDGSIGPAPATTSGRDVIKIGERCKVGLHLSPTVATVLEERHDAVDHLIHAEALGIDDRGVLGSGERGDGAGGVGLVAAPDRVEHLLEVPGRAAKLPEATPSPLGG